MMRQISVHHFEEEEHRKQRGALFTQQQLLLVAFFEDSNWFNWKENGTLCLNLKHLWEDQAGPCYTWSIKKSKLSKMNSTCSMKAGHRCVSLWGPPGRLSELSCGNWIQICFFLSPYSYCYNKLAGWAYVFWTTICAQNPVDNVLPVVIWRRTDPRPWHWSQ